MLRKFFVIFCLFLACSAAWAYEPTPALLAKAKTTLTKIETLLKSKTDVQKKDIIEKYDGYFTDLQNHALNSGSDESNQMMYLFEYLRRHLPGVDSFEEPDTIYDELNSIIWNHAHRGFDIKYFPTDTPVFGNVDATHEYSALINGSYFARRDGYFEHSGMLLINGVYEASEVLDDPQITHFVCVNASGQIRFVSNVLFAEDYLLDCVTVVQTGPMIYQIDEGVEETNYASNRYIGRPHQRSVLVLFQKNTPTISQDLWFLTVNEEVTLEEVRNIVLRETRFIGKYDDLWVLNLDGGSSVAHINTTHPELTIGRSKKLPVVFGIK